MPTDPALRSIAGGPARPIRERPLGEDDALIKAMALAIYHDAYTNEEHTSYVQDNGKEFINAVLMDGNFDLLSFATAALNALRKHQAGE